MSDQKRSIYIYVNKLNEYKGDTRSIHEEELKDGESMGLHIKYANITNDGKKESFQKIKVKEETSDSFTVTTIKDGETAEKTMSRKDLLDMLKKLEEMAFAYNYLTKKQAEFRKQQGGASNKKSTKKKSTKKKATKKKSTKKKATKKKSTKKKSTKKKATKKKSTKKKSTKKKSTKKKSTKKKSTKKK